MYVLIRKEICVSVWDCSLRVILLTSDYVTVYFRPSYGVTLK